MRIALLMGLALWFAPMLVSCDLPKDNAGTLDRVRGGEMRVGVAERPPWVRLKEDRATGIEPDLIKAWADVLGARIRWVHGSEGELVEALHRRELDVLAAGLEENTPYRSRLGMSQPYLAAKLYVAAPQGQAPPMTWKSLPVVVDPTRPALAGRVRELGAEPVASAAGVINERLAVAGYEFEFAEGLHPVKTLAEEKHVLAVSQGESAFLFALDKFLQEIGEDGAKRLAARESAR